MTLHNKYITDLSSAERSFIDNKFRLKIYMSNGQVFEDFFTSIMFALDNRFIKVKAWGNIGDRKNDGCVPDVGLYYQVFAPEDININATQYTALKKLKEDSEKLTSHWNENMPLGVKFFVYVINDKFSGTHSDLITELNEIKTKYNLNEANLFTADHLRLKFNKLSVLDIESILDMILPNINEFRSIDIKYNALNEVINYISKKSFREFKSRLIVPDWDDKIKFNKLGEDEIISLQQGDRMVNALDECLQSKGFSADVLQMLMTEIYLDVKNDFKDVSNHTNNDIFWEIINRCCPDKNYLYQVQIFPIMAKYFATCDIFEEPIKE